MADKKEVILVHMVPREPAGGVIDARQIINSVLEGKLFSNRKLVIITNDREVLPRIVDTDGCLEIRYIDTVPSFNEIHRLVPLILITLLKTIHASNTQAVFFLQEYPQILVPALFLAKITSSNTKIIVKLHSMSYIRHYVKYTLKVVSKILMKIILTIISMIFSLSLKLADIIIVPNPYMARELRRKKYNAIYIPPGNMIDYANVFNIISTCKAKKPKYNLLFASSKISGDDIVLFIKIMTVFHQLYGSLNSNYGIVGKATRYDYARVRKLLDTIANILGDKIIASVSLEGLPRDKILCEISMSDKVIISGYLDTWNYMLFEALVAGRTIYYIAQNTLTYKMMKSLLETLGLDSIIGLGVYNEEEIVLNNISTINRRINYGLYQKRCSELYIRSIGKIL